MKINHKMTKFVKKLSCENDLSVSSIGISMTTDNFADKKVIIKRRQECL